MHYIFKKTSHNRKVEFVAECKDIPNFVDMVTSWHENTLFEHMDGTVTDIEDREVYDPQYPTNFEFGDFDYTLVADEDLSEEERRLISWAAQKFPNGYAKNGYPSA